MDLWSWPQTKQLSPQWNPLSHRNLKKHNTKNAAYPRSGWLLFLTQVSCASYTKSYNYLTYVKISHTFFKNFMCAHTSEMASFTTSTKTDARKAKQTVTGATNLNNNWYSLDSATYQLEVWATQQSMNSWAHHIFDLFKQGNRIHPRLKQATVSYDELQVNYLVQLQTSPYSSKQIQI